MSRNGERPRSTQRHHIAVLAVLASLLVAGCGATSVGPQRADVLGTLKLCGGPPTKNCFSEAATITVTTARGHTVVGHAKEVGGRFSLSLPPGLYLVSATHAGGTLGTARVRVTRQRAMTRIRITDEAVD